MAVLTFRLNSSFAVFFQKKGTVNGTVDAFVYLFKILPRHPLSETETKLYEYDEGYSMIDWRS